MSNRIVQALGGIPNIRVVFEGGGVIIFRRTQA